MASLLRTALVPNPAGPSSSPGTKLKYKLPPSTLTAASSVQSTGDTSTLTTDAAIVAPDSAVPGADDDAPRVQAKTTASGFYARLAISANKLPAWQKAGVPLDPGRAQTFKWGAPPEWDQGKSEAECQRKCDDSVVCWGFLYDTATQACMYKGGEDSLNTRAFFVMPNMTVAATTPQSTPDESTIPPVAPSPSPSPAPSVVRKVCFSPSGPPSNTKSSVVEARYRIAQSGWDMALVPRVSINTPCGQPTLQLSASFLVFWGHWGCSFGISEKLNINATMPSCRRQTIQCHRTC